MKLCLPQCLGGQACTRCSGQSGTLASRYIPESDEASCQAPTTRVMTECTDKDDHVLEQRAEGVWRCGVYQDIREARAGMFRSDNDNPVDSKAAASARQQDQNKPGSIYGPVPDLLNRGPSYSGHSNHAANQHFGSRDRSSLECSSSDESHPPTSYSFPSTPSSNFPHPPPTMHSSYPPRSPMNREFSGVDSGFSSLHSVPPYTPSSPAGPLLCGKSPFAFGPTLSANDCVSYSQASGGSGFKTSDHPPSRNLHNNGEWACAPTSLPAQGGLGGDMRGSSPAKDSPGHSNRNSAASSDSGRGCSTGHADLKVAHNYVNVEVSSHQQQQHRLSDQSYESGVSSRQSYQSTSSSSHGSLDLVEEPGLKSTINVTQLVQAGVPDNEVLNAWLHDLHYEEYYPLFVQAGYDLPTISRMTPEDLTAVGITKPAHRKRLKAEIARLSIPDGIPDFRPNDIMEWLHILGLGDYLDTLCGQGYDNINYVTDITWEDLEEIGIRKLGHQKKIMLAIDRLKRIPTVVKHVPLVDGRTASLELLEPPPPAPPVTGRWSAGEAKAIPSHMYDSSVSGARHQNSTSEDSISTTGSGNSSGSAAGARNSGGSIGSGNHNSGVSGIQNSSGSGIQNSGGSTGSGIHNNVGSFGSGIQTSGGSVIHNSGGGGIHNSGGSGIHNSGDSVGGGIRNSGGSCTESSDEVRVGSLLHEDVGLAGAMPYHHSSAGCSFPPDVVTVQVKKNSRLNTSDDNGHQLMYQSFQGTSRRTSDTDVFMENTGSRSYNADSSGYAITCANVVDRGKVTPKLLTKNDDERHELEFNADARKYGTNTFTKNSGINSSDSEDVAMRVDTGEHIYDTPQISPSQKSPKPSVKPKPSSNLGDIAGPLHVNTASDTSVSGQSNPSPGIKGEKRVPPPPPIRTHSIRSESLSDSAPSSPVKTPIAAPANITASTSVHSQPTNIITPKQHPPPVMQKPQKPMSPSTTSKYVEHPNSQQQNSHSSMPNQKPKSPKSTAHKVIILPTTSLNPHSPTPSQGAHQMPMFCKPQVTAQQPKSPLPTKSAFVGMVASVPKQQQQSPQHQQQFPQHQQQFLQHQQQFSHHQQQFPPHQQQFPQHQQQFPQHQQQFPQHQQQFPQHQQQFPQHQQQFPQHQQLSQTSHRAHIVPTSQSPHKVHIMPTSQPSHKAHIIPTSQASHRPHLVLTTQSPHKAHIVPTSESMNTSPKGQPAVLPSHHLPNSPALPSHHHHQQQPHVQAFASCVKSLSEKFGKNTQDDDQFPDNASTDSDDFPPPPPPIAMDIITPKIHNYGIPSSRDRRKPEFGLQHQREYTHKSRPITTGSMSYSPVTGAQLELAKKNLIHKEGHHMQASGAIEPTKNVHEPLLAVHLRKQSHIASSNSPSPPSGAAESTIEPDPVNTISREKRSESTTSFESNSSSSSIDSNTLPFANENVGTIKQRTVNVKPLTQSMGNGQRHMDTNQNMFDVDPYRTAPGYPNSSSLSSSPVSCSQDNNVSVKESSKNFMCSSDYLPYQHKHQRQLSSPYPSSGSVQPLVPNLKPALSPKPSGSRVELSSSSSSSASQQLSEPAISQNQQQTSNVLSDIDNMLQGLTDELDAMLEEEMAS